MFLYLLTFKTTTSKLAFPLLNEKLNPDGYFIIVIGNESGASSNIAHSN